MFRRGDYFLDSWPEVEKCCYCLPLKFGAVVICLITMGVCVVALVPNLFFVCSGEHILTMATTKYMNYALYFGSACLGFASFVFLIGICWDKELTARIWIYCALIYLIFYLVFSILSIVGGFLDGCSPIPEIPIFAISVICLVYFLIIVKSYAYQDMND